MFGNKSIFGTPQTNVFGTVPSSSGFTFNTPKSAGFGLNSQPTSTSFTGFSKPVSTGIFNGIPSGNFNFSSTTKPQNMFSGLTTNPLVTTKPNAMFSFQPVQTNPLGSFFQNPNIGAPVNEVQKQQQQQHKSVDVFYASLSQPLLFGDERDNILARLNQLQAMLGVGTGYSALGTVTYTPDNTFSRFRGIAYNVLPTSTEADGFVCMEITRPYSEVITQKQGLQDTLFQMLGVQHNFQLLIEEIRPAASNTNTEVVLKLCERQASGSMHTIPSSDLANYLCGPTIKSQLMSQLSVCRLTPELTPSASQINAYLDIPPVGLDKLVWQQARDDNPAPGRLIPVPVVGFADLKRRHTDQLLFGDQQRKSVKRLLEITSELRTNQLSSSQRIAQLKRKQIELNHRVLKLLAKKVVARRAGFAISADEEVMRCALERIWTEITSPRGLRTRIQQLLPTLRSNLDAKMPSSGTSDFEKVATTMSELSTGLQTTWWNHHEIVEDLKEYLGQRNNGIKEMRRLLMESTNTLRVLTEKKAELSSSSIDSHSNSRLLLL